ncbi:hypothetical protein F5051DRAFT_18211 [Lentinula edodes]|nr:hypothetical protein F5051DRAFT_18211 [Lentinula edodes]
MNSANVAASSHYLQYDIKEIKYVWKAKLSRMTIYYIFCRYALLANVLYLLAVSNLLGSRSFGDL